MRRKRTHKEYIEEVAMVNPNLIVLEEYVDSRTPILHKCKIDGHQWKPIPCGILRGSGCPVCRNRKLREQRVKTQEQYEQEVAQIHPFIKVIGVYINTETTVTHRCLKDGYEWSAKPANILQGKGCPKCAGNLHLTNEEYISQLYAVNPNIRALEKYVNAKTPILHQCLLDDYTWETMPYSTLQGYGCPKCAGNLKKTHSEYILDLSIKNPDIEVIEQYINAKTPILHRCKIDGYEWKIAPSNVLCGQGCPQCQESNGEKRIRYWLDEHNLSYIYQKTFAECRYKKELPFDFYLPDLNVLIEYDGQQHFKPIDFAGKGEEWAVEQLKITQHRDEIKDRYCVNNNIKLLRIPYFKNIEEELEKFLFILI